MLQNEDKVFSLIFLHLKFFASKMNFSKIFLVTKIDQKNLLNSFWTGSDFKGVVFCEFMLAMAMAH